MVGSVKLYLSGGAANTNPANSIGGPKSTQRVYSQNVAYASTSISGVALIDGFYNTPGTGQLKFVASSDALFWKPPGAINFEKGHVVTGANGKLTPLWHEVESPGGAVLMVQVTEASLPGADTTQDVTVTRRENELFPDVTEQESKDGLIRYRGIYIENESSAELSISVSIGRQSQASDYFSIGKSAQGVDTEMTAIANDETAPASVTFYSSEDPDSLNVSFVLAATSYIGLWIRQTVPPLSTVGATPAVAGIRFKMSET